MKIRHVACIAPPKLGGIGTAALRMVEGLVARGHEAELVVPAAQNLKGEALVRPWPVRYAWGNAAVLADASRLFEGVDVLHLHYPFYGTAEALLWNPPPIPVVLSFHMDAMAKDWRGRIFDAHRRFVQPRLLQRASAVIVSSLDYARHSSLAMMLEKRPERIHEIPFFFDERVFFPTQAHESCEGHVRALFVGGLDRAHDFKGLEQVFQAMTRVSEACLAIVGDGDARSAYEARTQALGIQDRVRFLGRLSTSELVQAYQQADVLLFPSTSSAEAFGLVAMEAEACGTPVIASNLPGVRTVVQDGQTGWLIPPADVPALVERLRWIASHPADMAGFRERAALHARTNYRQERVMDQLEVLYQRVCV